MPWATGDPRPTEQFAAVLELMLAESGPAALARSQAAEIVAAADRNPLLPGARRSEASEASHRLVVGRADTGTRGRSTGVSAV